MNAPQPDWPQSNTPKATTDRPVPFSDLVEARNWAATVRSPLEAFHLASRILGFVAIVVAIVGVIGGLFVATIKDSADGSTPYVGLGIGLAFSNLVFAATLYWMSSFGKAWATKNDTLA